MLKIIVNSQEVDLGDLNGIEIQYNGCIFELKELVGTYTIPFSLPVSATNNRIFKFPYKVGTADNSVREYPAEIWHSGLLMASGTLSADTFTDSEFSCSVLIDSGSLFNKIKDEKLNEHYLGETWEDQAFNMHDGDYDVDTDLYVAYPVVNNQFLKNIPNFVLGTNYLQNKWDTAFQRFDLNSTIVTPFPLLWQTLRLLFSGLGYRYIDNFFTTPMLRSINIYSQRNIMIKTPEGDPYVYPLMPDSFNLCEQLPTITIADFIISIQNYFNIVFLIKNDTVTVVDRNYMLNLSTYDDYDLKISGSYTKKVIKKQNGWIFTATPDLTYELFTEIPDFSEKKNAVITNVLPTDTPVYSGDIRFYNEFVYMAEAKAGSTSELEWKKQRTYLKDGVTNHDNSYTVAAQNPYFSGNKETIIDLGVMPLPNWSILGIDTAYNHAPWVELPGNTYYASKTVDYKLRLSLFKGIVSRVFMVEAPEYEVVNCPFSTCGKPTDSYYLSARGSYEFHWKNFLPWYQEAMCEEYEQYINLDAHEIKNFDFSKKKKMHNNLWFVKSFSVQITRNGIMPAKCIMIKANY